MKVTILGSAGQIGAYLTDYLKRQGHIVVEFDVVNADWQDMTRIPNINLHDALSDTDFCFFLAFDVGGSRYLKKYQHTFDFIDNNSRIMVNAFQYLKKYRMPFVFASSQMSNMSYSPYGVLKRVGELYTKALDGLIVKFWNVYGIEKMPIKHTSLLISFTKDLSLVSLKCSLMELKKGSSCMLKIVVKHWKLLCLTTKTSNQLMICT